VRHDRSVEARYASIEAMLDGVPDFSLQELEKSRALFEARQGQVTPRRFDVWTCSVGLPLAASDLTEKATASRVRCSNPSTSTCTWLLGEAGKLSLGIVHHKAPG